MRQLKFLSILFFIAFFITNAQAQTQAPGLDVLGFGYDVFGSYAKQKSKKRYCLFKYNNYRAVPVGSKQYNVPQYVILENMSEHIVKTVEGSSMREYAKSQAASVGLQKKGFFFKGSVNASFSSSSSGTKKHYYYTYRDANTKWRISFDERSFSSLNSMLDPLFVKDLNNPDFSPSELFERYGTHFIASAYLGGRADFNAKSVMSGKTSTSDIASAVKAKYGSVSANASLSQSQRNTLSQSKTETKLVVTGGNSEYANNIDDPVTYEKWASGISEMPVLCDFDKNSLKPIWMFCKSDKRKNELKAEFNRMVKANPLPEAMANVTAMQNDAYMVQCKAGGLYWDFDGYNLDAKKYAKLELNPKDNKHGDYRQGFDRIVKFSPNPENPEYVRIEAQHYVTWLNLSDSEDYINLHAHDVFEPKKEFKLKSVDDENGYYYIQNRKTGKYLEAPKGKESQEGVLVALNEFTGADNQKWKLVEFNPKDIAYPKTAFYAVKSCAADKWWDFSGKYPDVSGTKLRSYRMGKQEGDRVYKFAHVSDGEFLIRPGHESSRVLTARKRGEQLFVFDQTRSDNQLFTFEYGGKPRAYKIRHKGTGDYIHLRSDRTNMDGTEIKIYKGSKGKDYQMWKLKFHKFK